MYICGINISCLHYDELLQPADNPRLVVTVNAEAIVRAQTDDRLKSIVNNYTTTIDGQIPLWLYRSIYRNSSIEKISGSELIYSLPEYAEKNKLRVFLLGGKEDSNKGAIIELRKRFPKLTIDGYSPPFSVYPFPKKIEESINNKISLFRPNILFVGFGMGKQEYWEDDNYKILNDLGVDIIVGCGGSFEFASGKIRRAPRIIQDCGLEGLWRLFKEFKWFRFKRLLISMKIFKIYADYHIFKTKHISD